MQDELEQFLAERKGELDHQIPDPAVLNRILQQIQQSKKKQPGGIVIPFRTLYWAVACLVLLALCAAFWKWQLPDVKTASSAKNVKPERIESSAGVLIHTRTGKVLTESPTIKSNLDSIDDDLATRKQALQARINTRKLSIKKQFVFASLRNMDSPAGRITAATTVNQFQNKGNDVVNALVRTLDQDPNANVRLAALDGLSKFYREPYVREKLVASLKKQQDPVVQITLIELLTRMRESGVLAELDQMVSDENTMKAVKDCAYSGIIRLRSI